ncbi:lipase family protein [Kaarinaea lacus]
MEETNIVNTVLGFINKDLLATISNNPWTSAIVSAVTAGLVGTGVFSFKRRIVETDESKEQYFADSKLLAPPIERPAYSDRMAYVLAEMSDLAYYNFEGPGGLINDAVENALKLKLDNAADIRSFLDSFSLKLIGTRDLSLDFFKDLLSKSSFELLDIIDVGETQGFACKRVALNEPSYVVIAFRGTEKKLSDWLTDLNAKPTEVDGAKVHTGFLEAFTVNTDKQNRTVKDIVDGIMSSPKAKDKRGNPLPLFITGHSLGGALALMATRLLADDSNGACYTYGAPRIGDYEYFKDLKTPVYRIVNSSDVVPRVPPGAGMILLIYLARSLSWLTGFIPMLSSMFKWIETKLDKLNGYRHCGDLRYLTDVAAGRFQDVRLLSNPPAIDRAIWMWKHMAVSLFIPVKQHSMAIYRKKLQFIASNRNKTVK